MGTRRRGWVWAFRLLLAFAVCAFLAFPAFAQVTNGIFTGVVIDPSNAVVPNATVTITNLGTGLVTTVKTNASGVYRAEDLPVGTYNIKVEATGFRTALRATVGLNAGAIETVNFTLAVGQSTTVVEVTAGTPMVQTNDFRLYQTVQAAQIANLPLNGRNVYDLMQLQSGAVNVAGVDFENGHFTVINGLRPDFIGFLLNGVADKGLSGGVDTVVNADLVQEFQQLSLNMSALYGNSAAGIINVVTKSGGNQFHGSAYEFLRNDKLDANPFFRNQLGIEKTPLHFNQFGGTIEGPIIKNHLFFTGSYQGERFITQAPPTPILSEAPEWRQAVESLYPNSVAALLYKNFPTVNAGTPFLDVQDYVNGGFSGSGFSSFAGYECAANYPANFQFLATNFQKLFGVMSTDNFSSCSSGAPALQPGLISRTMPFLNNNALVFGSQTTPTGNLFNGNEGSGRIDWQGKNDRVFGEFYWQGMSDSFGPSNASSGIHGFKNPTTGNTPNFQFSYLHTFSPTFLNEFRAGYVRNASNISVAVPGVPSIAFDDGSAGFGSYNGYPQFFHENVYTYSDMVSITKGNHDLKFGGDIRRNLENSEFNVARPSYNFFDQFFFSQDAPYGEVAGVDPGFVSGQPAQLATNKRYWRNLEFGAYFQDDWKVRRNFTLNLGIRYDLFTRHREKYGLVTTFIPGPGASIPGNGFFLDQIQNANVPLGTPGCESATQLAEAVLAGVCGPGGFAIANSLGRGNLKNFSPRLGFAWDPTGSGKTSVRGGFGISYEGTLYNPLSNSRWNPPFYSFNLAFNSLVGDVSNVVYGPVGGGTPTFTGPAPPQQHSGVGAQATGNINGWNPTNPNTAFLTGIVFPDGIRDPRIYNYFFGVQRQFLPNTVLEVDYVGTQGIHLFRAENANRIPGGALPVGTCVTAQGRQLCSFRNDNLNSIGNPINPVGRLNPNYGTLRVWANVSKSWYNSLQVGVRHQTSHGLLFNANYTYSHSIDIGSTWHSGATTANGAAAGEGFSLDDTRPNLDRGDSIFDIRHRLTFNYVYEFPWFKSQQGFLGHVLGGWQYNGLWTFQSGAHWEPFCSAGGPGGRCDFNKDGVANDRPDAPNGNTISINRQQWANGIFPTTSFGCAWNSTGACSGGGTPFFATPCLGCDGNLGRNTLVGPGQWDTDESIFKIFKVRENMNLEFRAEIFNAFNRANFILGSSATGGSASNKITSPIFGQAGGTLDPREIQFGLKLLW